jgi:phage terminase small subunit
MTLTHKQQLFVEHYLTCLNATEAARRAGYSPKTAYSIGSENLTKPEIAAEIDRRVSEVAMSADEVLRRLADHARGTIEDFVSFVERDDPVTGNKETIAVIDLEHAREMGKLHLLKKLREDKDGSRTIELHDPQAALGQLGRYHGLFLDKTALTDPTGKHPVPVIYLPQVVPTEGDGNS